MVRTLLKSTFIYKKVPFLIKVVQAERYIHKSCEKIRGVNFKGKPAGLDSSKGWYICECIVAKVRPDYPYTIKEEWPPNVNQHFSTHEPLEIPKRKLFRYTKVERNPQREPKEMAKDVKQKLKNAYASGKDMTYGR